MKNFKKVLSAFLTVSLSLGGNSLCMASGANTIEKGHQTSAEKKTENKSWGIKEYAISAVSATVGIATLALGGKCIYERTRPWYGHDMGNLCEDDIMYIERVIKNCEVRNYSTALICAASHGCDFYVLRLLDVIGRDRVLINCRDSSGCTALIYACEFCKIDTIKALINFGASVNMPSVSRPDSLDAFGAARQRCRRRIEEASFLVGTCEYLEILQLLVKSGFRFGIDSSGLTNPDGGRSARLTQGRNLTACLSNRHLAWDQVRYCCLAIEAGADVTVTDSHGRTPLVLAAIGGYADVVRALLTHARNRITDADRVKARRAAERNHHQEIADLLR